MKDRMKLSFLGGKIMEPKDRLNALEVALNNEMKERAFYMKHAQRTQNPIGKAMFQQIGDEELGHYERLKELHQRWGKNEKWPETVPFEVEGTLVKDVLKDLIKKVNQIPAEDADDLEAVRTAIDFEAKGVTYYVELRDSVSDPKEKAFFDLLSRLENEHYLSLKDTEEYFIDAASWYRKLEHHTFDGE